MSQPIYTAENCSPAYQLRWSLALFEKRQLPPEQHWLDALKLAAGKDGVRILDVTYQLPKCWLFLLSTTPDVAPSAIVKSVKGRWQHLLRPEYSRSFQRNFSLTSVGEANCDMVNCYVAGQVAHHSSEQQTLPAGLVDYQWNNPEVDLRVPQFSSHGRYIANLHLVFEHSGRRSLSDVEHWQATRGMIRKAAAAKGHRLSNAGILLDHLHLFLGINVDDCPGGVALSYMNNLAFAHQMQRVYSFGYYTGTVGPYHMQAIRQHSKDHPPTDPESVDP